MMTNAGHSQAQDNADIFDASRNGDLLRVKELLAQDTSHVHAKDNKGFTPLVLAVYNNQPEIARHLLENGAEVDAQDASGNTALMGICFKGYEHLASLLLEFGADPEKRNLNEATALTFAATFNHTGIARMLLEKGADAGVVDSRGNTPLDHAKLQGNEQMITLLTDSYTPQ